jgi:hypothetical protein
MSEANSTMPAESGKPAKPAKPYPDFPLYAHGAGVWAKKIRGMIHYFGPWDDPAGALARYEQQKDALLAGRKPRPDTSGLTVKDAVNAFLEHKDSLVDAGELASRTWGEYKETCDLLVASFGKGRLVADLGPDDFATLRKQLAKRWGPTRLGNGIQRVRSVFKYAAENDLIERPVRFGQGFARLSAKVIRLHKAKTGGRMLEAEELRRVLGKAGAPLKAMLLLGLNCGFGNHDVATLPLPWPPKPSGNGIRPSPRTPSGKPSHGETLSGTFSTRTPGASSLRLAIG